MIKIYHNNRCRKSREGLQTLKELGQEFEIIDYISNPLGVDELTIQITKVSSGLVSINIYYNDSFRLTGCRVFKHLFNGYL